MLGIEDILVYPRKRQRLDAISSTNNSEFLQCSPTRGTSLAASLQSLPAEILDMILSISCEASLIHISQTTRHKLPGFVAYTKRASFEALLPLKEWKDENIVEPGHFDHINQIRSYLTHDMQTVIQEKVFSTYWFREAHVNHVRRVLLNWSIRKACSVYFQKLPSRSQDARIKSFVDSQRVPQIGKDLNLRLRCDNSRLVYLTATPFEVEVSERRVSFYQAFEFRVLDFGNTVPDFLLQHPLCAAKQAMLRGICKWQDSKSTPIRCNFNLLRTLILDCIIFEQLSTYYELLKLASATVIALGLIHIERVVMLGRTRMLTPLLKQVWQQRQPEVSDMDLIALIDHAKAHEYPNWSETTRILAMEVAAMWKIAEVERTGGAVVRALSEWPPRLSITRPGDRCPQSWWLPKDPRHEVDWESSEFRGWIQLRLSA